MSGRLLRVLHWFGLTNLTDEQVREYVRRTNLKENDK